MSEANDVVALPADVQDLIGKLQYEEAGEFPVERGYFWTSAASVENGNPIFWDDTVAEEVTGGPVAPLSLLSAWFRPHHWAPGREVEKLPLQIHFDLKARFELPEAIMTENVTTFHEPIRPGDLITSAQRLVSVSEEQTRRLGTGRFWVIDVEYRNHRGELCGIERWTGFGYRRTDSPGDPR